MTSIYRLGTTVSDFRRRRELKLGDASMLSNWRIKWRCSVLILFVAAFANIANVLADDSQQNRPARDVRFLIDTSSVLLATDPQAVRKLLPDVVAKSMLKDGDFFGVWQFGAAVEESISYGRITDARRELALSNSSYLQANSRVRNLRAALEAISFSNTAVSAGQTEVYIVTQGPVFSRSPIKDALFRDYIIQSIAPALKNSDIKVNIIEFSNDGELFYRKLATMTGGKYLTLKSSYFPALSALQFVGGQLGTAVEVATNASFAITSTDEDVVVVVPGADRRKVQVDHPDGWLLAEPDSPETIRFDYSGPNLLVTLSKQELKRLDLDVSFWAVRGVPSPGAIIVGQAPSFLAGVVPSAAEILAQREKAKSRPVYVPPPEVVVVEDEVVEPFVIDSAEASLLSLIKGEVGIEGRYFFEEGNFGQPKENVSLRFQPELDYLTESGDDLFEVTLFGRIDQNDSERSHWDIRELLWTHVGGGWESKAGIGKVFWGVTESQHLVDIINQTDLVEQPDGEAKLGQPMLKLGLEYELGNLDLFVLPYFRERTFSGVDGRFQFPLPVDVDKPIYESSQEEWHTDFSARFYGYTGDLEYALSWFWGTTRDPLLVFNGDYNAPKLRPLYNLIDQTGLELQYIYDAWLLKFEGISRGGQGDRFAAVTTGFEYTQVGIFEGNADLGWLVEYLWDERGDDSPTIFDRDIFIGWRWTANDIQSSSAVVGVVWDPESDETLFKLEAERRLASNMKLNVDIGFYTADDPISNDPLVILQELASPNSNNKLGFLNKEDFVQVELTWFF